MSDIEFVDGLIVKRRENAPDFVVCNLSIKRDEFIAWLQARSGEWVNLDVKKSKAGKLYAAVDNFKPNQRQDAPARPKGDGAAKPAVAGAPISDDIPF